MYNCYKSVQEIIQEFPALSDLLLDAGNYYAHTPGDNFSIPKETLEEHINLVNSYFKKLVSAHRLDPVIDNLINGLSAKIDNSTGNLIKQLFVNTIIFHDFGKINEKFQAEKMKNEHFQLDSQKYHPIGSTHASLGAFIYLSKHMNDTYKAGNKNFLLLACCLYFSYSIFRHHNRMYDDNISSTISFDRLRASNNIDDLKKFLAQYLQHYKFSIDPQVIQQLGNDKLFAHPGIKACLNSFNFYILSRLNFSLLTASDYLATNEYHSSFPIDDLGLFTNERIQHLHEFVSKSEWINKSTQKKNYNKAVYDNLDKYQFLSPLEKGNQQLNILRREMAIEVIRNIRQFYNSNLFYIEAPTGGGKTNLSLLAVVELLKRYEGVYNKVFYVFPFTTLITQTYAVARDMLSLSEEEIVELHSRAGLKQNNEEDDVYGNQKINYINYLFANYPFSLLSHVHFFDILKTNEK